MSEEVRVMSEVMKSIMPVSRGPNLADILGVHDESDCSDCSSIADLKGNMYGKSTATGGYSFGKPSYSAPSFTAYYNIGMSGYTRN